MGSLTEEFTWFRLVATLLALVVVIPLGQMMYNAFFHPLASFPGPRMHAASVWPYQYYQVRGKGSHHIADLHEAYGPVVRFSPNQVSYIKSSAWKEIYGPKIGRSGLPLQRDRTWVQDKQQFGAWNLMVADPPDHIRQRKQLAPALSDRALREQEPIILGYIDFFVKRLHETAGQAINLSDIFNYTTFDIVGELAFGENEFQCLDQMRAHPWVAMIYALMDSMAIFGAIMAIAPWLAPALNLLMPKKIKEEVDAHVHTTISFVDRRLTTQSSKPDFISYILRETKAGPSSMLENREIYATSASVVIAGSETSATSLSGAVYLLLKNPDKLAKLADEIRGRFPSEADINPRSTAELKYLRAVLDEVQRVYPAVPKHGERLVPEGGCVVDGKFIPPGIIVGITPYAAYHSESNFRDAGHFVPERWLGDEKYADDDRDMFWPFGFGPYNCMGTNMAQMEMRTILSRLVWNFDMELLPESDDWMDQKATIIWHRRPLMVRLRKREA